MAAIMRSRSDPLNRSFRDTDIYNDRRRIRQEQLGGLSPTKAWIQVLQEQQLKYFIHYDDEQRVQSAIWTYPWCEKMLKKFPEVIGLDNTYKTNRFNMFLFQITGVADHKSSANFAFGLINTEKEDGYLWLCHHLDQLRDDLNVPILNVIITHKEASLKNALPSVFPGTQQQLCVHHINGNVRERTRSKWKNPAGDEDADEDSRGDEDPSCSLNATIQVTNQVNKVRGISTAILEADDNLRDGMPEAWQSVINAPTEDDFKAAWKKINNALIGQEHVLYYISSEYMPWRYQYAQCYMDQYRNFGRRTNSPSESNHRNLKNFLHTGTSHVFHLHLAVIQMLHQKERIYKEKAAEMNMRHWQKYSGQRWLGKLPTQVTLQALELIYR